MARGAVAATFYKIRGVAHSLRWLAVLAIAYPAAVVGAWWPSPALLAWALATAVVADRWGLKRTKDVFKLLNLSQLGAGQRQVVLDGAVLLFVWRSQLLSHHALGLAAGGMILTQVIFAVFQVGRVYVERRRALPMRARNLNVPAISVTPWPKFLLRLDGRRARWVTAPVAVGAIAGDLLDSGAIVLAGVAVAVVAGLAALGLIALNAARVRHLGDRAAVIRKFRRQLDRYAPEVVLYYSGTAGTAYQVNMWLSTLSALGRRPLVLLRQPERLSEIAPTSVPLLAVPGGADVMDLDLPTVKLAFYVGNVGHNQHLIRHPGMTHVFVGHGDSDKLASANPVSRIYDQVWVAGPAGRERYHRANVGVRDEAIVEVGRPQLAAVARRGVSRPPVFTVLYAPTWEGWTTDMFLTSVEHMGPGIVRTLLSRYPDVRVVYKPHPLTGLRSETVRRAHAQIVELLAAANRTRTARPAEVQPLTGDESPDERFWRTTDPGEHLVITSAQPHLYSCFNHADMMISDISSVVSDFIASDKPYVVTNPGDVDLDQFRDENTAARGAYLLGRDCAELPAIVDAIRGVDGDSVTADPMAERRSYAREYLLGPDEPDAITRFRAAVEAVFARYERRDLTADAVAADEAPDELATSSPS